MAKFSSNVYRIGTHFRKNTPFLSELRTLVRDAMANNSAGERALETLKYRETNEELSEKKLTAPPGHNRNWSILYRLYQNSWHSSMSLENKTLSDVDVR